MHRDREVRHETVVGGAVPVLLAGRTRHGLSRVSFEDDPVAGADQPDPADDVQRLTRTWWCQKVRAPGEKRTMLTLIRDGLTPGMDHVEPDVAGEDLGWPLGGRWVFGELHGVLLGRTAVAVQSPSVSDPNTSLATIVAAMALGQPM